MRAAGIEPASAAWKAAIIAVILRSQAPQSGAILIVCVFQKSFKFGSEFRGVFVPVSRDRVLD